MGSGDICNPHISDKTAQYFPPSGVEVGEDKVMYYWVVAFIVLLGYFEEAGEGMRTDKPPGDI